MSPSLIYDDPLWVWPPRDPAPWDFSPKNFESHEILIRYTGGGDVSRAEYCIFFLFFSSACFIQASRVGGGVGEGGRDNGEQTTTQRSQPELWNQCLTEATQAACCWLFFNTTLRRKWASKTHKYHPFMKKYLKGASASTRLFCFSPKRQSQK